jgi:hypothetical protein
LSKFAKNLNFKNPNSNALLSPFPNFKIQSEFKDGSKSKVGDLGKLSNFHFWRFSSSYMNLEENG